jgi:hypothetical protein
MYILTRLSVFPQTLSIEPAILIQLSPLSAPLSDTPCPFENVLVLGVSTLSSISKAASNLSSMFKLLGPKSLSQIWYRSDLDQNT